MFKKLINRIRGTKLQDLDINEFTLEHCVTGVCKLAELAKDQDAESIAEGIAQSVILAVNKQREDRNLAAVDIEGVRALYAQSGRNPELFGHLIYETAIGHR